jgi:hypothetical protein
MTPGAGFGIPAARVTGKTRAQANGLIEGVMEI